MNLHYSEFMENEYYTDVLYICKETKNGGYDRSMPSMITEIEYFSWVKLLRFGGILCHMKLTFLGTGTSHGIPVIACDCPVCTSSDPKDQRNRCSVFIEDQSSDLHILIDAGPEFRIQAIKYKIKKLDTLLLTHSHADHLHGVDDIRIFSCTRPAVSNKPSTKIPVHIYGNDNTISDFRNRFDYMFIIHDGGGGVAHVDLNSMTPYSTSNPLVIKNCSLVPVDLEHGHTLCTGYVINKKLAYLTDVSRIPEHSFKRLAHNNPPSAPLEHLIIDGLRPRPHSTHFSFDQALEAADRIGAKHTWITHICHDMCHKDIEKYIEERLPQYKNLQEIVKNGGTVSPAWDGLEILF